MDSQTVAISLELSNLFPTLLCLSSKEIVAIWDAVSAYILEQLKLGKGVFLPGLGTFAMVQEEFQGEQEVFTIRRPVFQLNIDVAYLQELMFQIVTIPANATIKPLNYWWLSQATSIPRFMVEDCVRETILLYSFQLRNRQRPSFIFKDIGVLSCQHDVLCMRFYYDCVTGLESKASRIALLHTRLWTPCAAVPGGASTAQGMPTGADVTFPRFRFVVISKAVAKALGNLDRKAAVQHRRATEGHLEKVLQRPRICSLPALPRRSTGTKLQDMGKKTSSQVLQPCPGSSPRSEEAGRQKAARPASPTAAPPSSEGCRRALQEVRQLSAAWYQSKSRLHERLEQAKAEAAAWKAWSAGETQKPPQAFGTEHTWTPHPPAQCRQREVNWRWRKAEKPLPAEEMAAAAQLKRLQPDLLSPRAAQVLRRLEPHQAQGIIYKNVAEHRRQRQEQQRQLPCTRCGNRSRGGSARSGSCGSGS